LGSRPAKPGDRSFPSAVKGDGLGLSPSKAR
jgi:hypothetical protein